MKQVVCIDNVGFSISGPKITLHKVYDVISESERTYYIDDDSDHTVGVFKERFITIEEYRERKINNVI